MVYTIEELRQKIAPNALKYDIPDVYSINAILDAVISFVKRFGDFNERLRTQIKDICTVLIKGSLEEARA
jgi:type I restriction enzyme S subunit